MTTRGGMVAVAVVALGLASAALAVVLLAGSLAVVAVRGLIVAPDGSAALRRSVSYLVTLACLYLPYGWLVVVDHPWNAYWWSWVTMWPLLPGLAFGLLFHPNDLLFRYGMAVGAVVLVALFTWLGGLGKRALAVSGLTALVGSGLQSWFALACFLM